MHKYHQTYTQKSIPKSSKIDQKWSPGHPLEGGRLKSTLSTYFWSILRYLFEVIFHQKSIQKQHLKTMIFQTPLFPVLGCPGTSFWKHFGNQNETQWKNGKSLILHVYTTFLRGWAPQKSSLFLTFSGTLKKCVFGHRFYRFLSQMGYPWGSIFLQKAI